MSRQVRPPLDVPKGLAPVIRFAKLPPSARPVVRRVLDADPGFRARVALLADEVGVARGPWLYLHRPPGWAGELAGLIREVAGDEASAAAQRDDRSLRRRLAGAEEAVGRLEEALAAARLEASRRTDELAAERRARKEAEAELEGLHRRVASAEAEREAAHRKEAVARAELGEAAAKAAAAEQAAGAGVALGVRHTAELRAWRSRAEAAEAVLGEALQASARRDGLVAEAVSRATQAAAAVGDALALASRELDAGTARPDPGPVIPPAPPADDTADTGATGAPRSPTPPRAHRRAARRRVGTRQPLALPAAVFDDSPEAADHLVRVPGMLVLVDGYNVTLSAWGELPIAVQRSRLVAACAELNARTGAEVLIVFDGAEEPGDLPPPGSRIGVRWRFTSPEVEADDELLDLVVAAEATRPVVVASSDRRVRDGARGLGANAISTPQLLAVLRRWS